MKKADSERLSSVAALGCIVCRRLGFPGSPAEIHHIRAGMGKGQRASHQVAIGLCPFHHRNGGFGEAFHAGKKTWQEKFGTEMELLNEVNNLLGIKL
jgi:hypothetical protein